MSLFLSFAQKFCYIILKSSLFKNQITKSTSAMKFSIAIKILLSCVFFSSGVLALRLRKQAKTGFLILMYHRIIPQQEALKGVQEGMYVEPDTFNLHLRFLQKYFAVVPISEIASGYMAKTGNPKNKPVCTLTFDDGWSDFYRYAFPILKAYQMPATVFLPTDFIGSSKWFWTDRLAYLLMKKTNAEKSAEKKKSSPDPLVRQLENLKGSQMSRLEYAIETLKPLHIDEIEKILSELSVRWKLNQDPPGRGFLTWEEVREMTRSGLISYGSHTATHSILPTLLEEEIKEELKRSRERLIAEKAVSRSMITFCYPNGNFNKKIAGMVRDSGYSLAVTTRKGWNDKQPNPFALRRIGVHQDMSSTQALFGCRIANIF